MFNLFRHFRGNKAQNKTTAIVTEKQLRSTDNPKNKLLTLPIIR